MEDILGVTMLNELQKRKTLRKKAAELAGQKYYPEFTVTQNDCIIANGLANKDGGYAYMNSSIGEILVTAALTAEWYHSMNADNSRARVIKDYTAPAIPDGYIAECDQGHKKFLGGKKEFYLSRCKEPGCKSFVRSGAALASKRVEAPTTITEEIPF